MPADEAQLHSDLRSPALDGGEHPAIACLQAGAVFLACLLSTFLFAEITIRLALRFPRLLPTDMENFFYFFNQETFPYAGFSVAKGGYIHPVFARSTAMLLNIAQWCLVTIAFSWGFRRMNYFALFPAAFLTMLLVNTVVETAFRLSGIILDLNGL